MGGDNEVNKSMMMGCKLPKGMTGCYTVKANLREEHNRKRVLSAKQRKKKHGK
jgi:hypothetical protein